MKTTTENSHAIGNARAHLADIVAAFEACQFLADTLTGSEIGRDAKALLREHGFPTDESDEIAESICDAMRETPLSVLIRDGWHNPGEAAEPEEFEILLSTGGPALRIIGKLGRYNMPEDPTLQWQDWGTHWTDHETTNTEDEALGWFAGLFYFGD